jgi:Meiotically up-regulated gene 113
LLASLGQNPQGPHQGRLAEAGQGGGVVALSNKALDAMVAIDMPAKMFAEVVKADQENACVFLYVIGPVSGNPPFKFGISRNPFERLTSIQTGCPGKLAVLYTLPAGGRNFALNLEREIHEHFEEYRGIGEWFNIPNDPPGSPPETRLHCAIRGIKWIINSELREREEDIEIQASQSGYHWAEKNARSLALLNQ